MFNFLKKQDWGKVKVGDTFVSNGGGSSATKYSVKGVCGQVVFYNQLNTPTSGVFPTTIAYCQQYFTLLDNSPIAMTDIEIEERLGHKVKFLGDLEIKERSA